MRCSSALVAGWKRQLVGLAGRCLCSQLLADYPSFCRSVNGCLRVVDTLISPTAQQLDRHQLHRPMKRDQNKRYDDAWSDIAFLKSGRLVGAQSPFKTLAAYHA